MKAYAPMTVFFLKRADKPALAYHLYDGERADLPLVMFCGGYKSDMGGTKAMFLEAFCRGRGQGYLRFDYSGHGASGGAFEDGTIGAWRDDALDIYQAVAHGRAVILVGSSMGGWMALLMALRLGDAVKAVVGIAAAPDFTVRLWEKELSDAQRATVLKDGRLEVPNDYSDEPYIFTKALFDDGRKNLLLDRVHDLKTPMVLLQGKCDADVPWETAVEIERAFPSAPVTTIFIDDGDHRLSRVRDLEILAREIATLS